MRQRPPKSALLDKPWLHHTAALFPGQVSRREIRHKSVCLHRQAIGFTARLSRMTEQYDATAALHYAAYRPPLHSLILQRLIQPSERFRLGLDVGCGTGYSSVALAAFCDRVTGIDSSPAMLAKAQPHPNVTYCEGSGRTLDAVSDASIDVVSFAGSLVYTKSSSLEAALRRVSTRAGIVLIYDFEIQLDPLMHALGVSLPHPEHPYDHSLGIAEWTDWQAVLRSRERVPLNVTASEATHLLLSDSNRYSALQQRHPGADLYGALVASHALQAHASVLCADIFLQRYHPANGGFVTVQTRDVA